MGEDCMVVAPSMIPRKSGERQKTDQRDASSLAVLHRGGLLTAVWVPDAAHEAMRDLIRARLAVRAVRAARQQLSAFLLRHERTYAGKKPWTKVHRRWLADQSFAQPAHQIVLEECIEAVRQGEQRRDRVDGYLRAQIPHWSLFPLVRNLCALRGVDMIAAAGLAAAIGDPSRFATAPDFMAYLGMVPSEQSRRRSRPHPIDRGCAQLPPPGPHRAPQGGRCRYGAGDSARDRLEGADPVVPALPLDDGEG
jgi:transposase